VVFRASGLVYAFDTQHFMNTLLSAYLFLAIAVFVMDFVTFNLLPNGISKVLYAKRAERVSKLHTFAQLGLKAAVAVKDFKSLDYDGQGFIDVKNLVSVFGGIPTIGKEQALLIAQTIIRAADTDTNLQGRISFNEFMTLFDGADGIDFDQYVDLVHTTGKLEKIDAADAAAAEAAYDAVEAGVDAKKLTESQGNAEVTRLGCYLCHTVFGVPSGARIVKCPSCSTANIVTSTTPTATPPTPSNPVFNLFSNAANFAQQIVRQPGGYPSAAHTQPAVVMGAPAGYAQGGGLPNLPRHLPVTHVYPQATSSSTNDVPHTEQTL